MQTDCPVHATPMTPTLPTPRDGELWHCASCQCDYRPLRLCDLCGNELQHLQACGASDWFCNHCDLLRSRASLMAQWVAVKPETLD